MKFFLKKDKNEKLKKIEKIENMRKHGRKKKGGPSLLSAIAGVTVGRWQSSWRLSTRRSGQFPKNVFNGNKVVLDKDWSHIENGWSKAQVVVARGQRRVRSRHDVRGGCEQATSGFLAGGATAASTCTSAYEATRPRTG